MNFAFCFTCNAGRNPLGLSAVDQGMKKRSMLAIASLAAGVVTALVTPPPHASAAEHGATGATGLLQNDNPVAPLLDGAAPQVADALPEAPGTGGLL
jgi:hypothetical protein